MKRLSCVVDTCLIMCLSIYPEPIETQSLTMPTQWTHGPPVRIFLGKLSSDSALPPPLLPCESLRHSVSIIFGQNSHCHRPIFRRLDTTSSELPRKDRPTQKASICRGNTNDTSR
jgi:hypothetical protein